MPAMFALPTCPPTGADHAASAVPQVENISLLSTARDNGFVGVNMYVDDEGSIRGLPRNLRASEIAHCCGRPLEVRHCLLDDVTSSDRVWCGDGRLGHVAVCTCL